jgi:hypothetical protein
MLKPNLKLKKDLNLSFRFGKMLHIIEVMKLMPIFNQQNKNESIKK